MKQKRSNNLKAHLLEALAYRFSKSKSKFSYCSLNILKVLQPQNKSYTFVFHIWKSSFDVLYIPLSINHRHYIRSFIIYTLWNFERQRKMRRWLLLIFMICLINKEWEVYHKNTYFFMGKYDGKKGQNIKFQGKIT